MTRKQKKILIRIILSAILLIAVSLIPIRGNFRAVLYLIPYLTVGFGVLISAVKNISRGQVFDEQFLMLIATVGAFIIGEYSEAVFVMLFYQVGELFGSIAVNKSRKSITALMDIKPDSATVIRNGTEAVVSPDEVLKGEIIIVRAGEKIPLDGIVTKGESSLNTSALTGESVPLDVSAGDRVISGSVNLSGVLEIKTDCLYTESTVSKILDLVENSTSKKAKYENFITKFARYYTPIVVIAAALLALLPPLFFNLSFAAWIKRALIFLVISCPCALVLSVPLTFFGGIGGAARRGILIKGANYIEVLSKTDTFIFDKTGTLTSGEFKINEINPNGIEKEELLKLAAIAESYSNHPLAAVLAKECDDKPNVKSYKEHSGMGVEVELEDVKILAGNKKLMEFFGVEYNPVKSVGTPIYIVRDNYFVGSVVLADEIKENSKKAILSLKKMGVKKTVMLTGDKTEIAEDVAKKLDIDEFDSELLPDSKLEFLEKNLENNGIVSFVGDGVNDAPCLARADVGIAMGALGSDAAIEAADVVLMDDNIEKLSLALKISRKTIKIARQNIALALIVKGAVLLLGALGFTEMGLAIFADVGVTVIAVLNALRTQSLV